MTFEDKLICTHCQQSFQNKPTASRNFTKTNHFFCSRACMHAWQRQGIPQKTFSCHQCHLDFTKTGSGNIANVERSLALKGRVFCSHQCWGQYRRVQGMNLSLTKRKTITKPCPVCQISFTRNASCYALVCSRTCAGKQLSHNSIKILTCLNCGQEFMSNKSTRETAKHHNPLMRYFQAKQNNPYCSPACTKDYRRKEKNKPLDATLKSP